MRCADLDRCRGCLRCTFSFGAARQRHFGSDGSRPTGDGDEWRRHPRNDRRRGNRPAGAAAGSVTPCRSHRNAPGRLRVWSAVGTGGETAMRRAVLDREARRRNRRSLPRSRRTTCRCECMSKTLVLSRVFPPQVGGSGRWMWELYSRMPVGDFLVVAGNWPGSAEFDTRQKLPIERLPLHLASWGAVGWRRGAEYAALYQRVRALVREHHVRTLHAACCLPEGFLAWMLRRRYGIPYQVYVHGEELNVARTSRELTWMTRRVFDNAQTIVANSRNTAGLLRTGWNAAAERIHVLHPGVDTGRYQPVPRELEARQRLGWGSDTVILSVGRLQRRKGHAQIVRALPEIRKVVPDVLFAIVGDGDEREPLRQLIDQLGVQDQ